jgi:succinyl-CoA synthetase alpha subunit
VAILVDRASRVIVQGATGTVGRAFAERLARHYPNYAGGVTPGRGGQAIGSRPVWDTVAEAVAQAGANASVIAVPAAHAADAVYEAVDAGIRIVTIYTDLIPLHEVVRFVQYGRAHGTVIIGPNAAGVVSPGQASLSELNDASLCPGAIGVVAKSASLSYEVIQAINCLGLGQSSVCCLGGDPIIGTRFNRVLELFEADPDTRGVVLLGEVGGSDEFEALPVLRAMTKPVVAYVAGHAAPPGKSMGHAGAIVSRAGESAAAKSALLREAGVHVVDLVDDIGACMAQVFTA